MKNQAKLLVQVMGLALIFVISPKVRAQVVYNEGFEITNGATVTYPLASMPMGWSTSKYCTTVGSYTTGTCNSTSPGFSRYGAASSFPTCSPRTGNTMLGFNSYYIINGEKAFVASKKLDINTIGANSVTGSLWMYRDSGLYNATFDSISIHVNNSPSITTTAKRVTLNGLYNSMPRSYSQAPACPANSWYQLNFTIPNADVATWSTQGIYIIIMGHSADGNQIYLDDFSIQEYPLAAPSVVAAQIGLTVQNTTTTQPNQLNQVIVGAKIQSTGSNATSGTKLTINNWTFNTNGSNNPSSDISAAKLWWTGGTNAFDASLAVLIGTVANPWATNYTFLTTAWGGGVDPNLWLQYGDNYFWVTYDITPSATMGNFVDAEWVSGQYNGATALSITPQSLIGARLIDLTYCIPAYAVGTSWAGYTNNDYVQCVQLDDLNGTGGINNGPLGNTPLSAAGPNCPTPGNPCGFQSHPPDYEFFLPGVNKTAILTSGNTYQIKVACGTWFSSNYIAAWIDYNKTGTFTNTMNIGATATLMGAGGGEKICQSPSLVNSGGSCNGPLGSNFIQQFTIPPDAIPGNTRLRVREVYATSQIDPCAYATYGETEDYVVTIIPPCAPAWIGWKTWLGFTDDWNNPANWCGGVPTINDNARIPVYGSGPNDRPGNKMPRIKSGITAVAKNLRIEAPATTSDTSAFLIDAAAMGANGLSTASLTVAEDLNALANSRIKVISGLSDTAQLSNGVLRTPTVPSTVEPFTNNIKKRYFYILTQSELLSEGIVANDIIDTILIHMKRNGTTTEPMRNFTIKYYYTDGTVPGFTFNGAPFTGVASTSYRNMPNIIGATPITIYGPANLATSTFVPTTGGSGTITLPLIPNSFKWDGSTNKLVIEMIWDNTSSGIVPFGNTENTTFTQTSTQGYRHAIGISETKVTSTYTAANFVVPFAALPQTNAAGAITWTAGTNTMASTYANATFAVGQWVSGTGISVLKGATAVTAGNATITLATGTTGIQVGMYVSPSGGWAAGVAPQITAVAAGSVTLSIAPTTTGTYNLTFCPYITGLSSTTPPYTSITLNCVLPGSTTAGNLSFGSLHTTPTVGADYRSNMTFKVRRPYGKFPIEVRKDWVNQGEFVPGVSRVSMTTTTAGVVDSMYNASPTSFYDLVINNSDGVKLHNADITITDTLTLTAGRLKANNKLITLANDTLPGVLVRTGGGIQLDQDVLGSDVAPYGRFRWLLGSATGAVDIPFYNQANTYIPFTYNRVSGKHYPTFATYATPSTNLNKPAPVSFITALNQSWTNGDGIVDRYYFISNAGVSPKADLTYRYANSERAVYTNTNMRVQRWTGTGWEKTIANGGTFPLPGQVHTIASPADGVFLPNTSYNMTAAGDWWTIVGEPTPLADTTGPAVYIAGTFSVCQGNAATLTASSGFSSYLWNTGATTQTINPTTSGIYTVTATDAQGVTVSASQQVTINSNPTPTITGVLAVCQGTAATLTASASSTYLWSTGATTQTINPTSAGTYTVTVTNVNGCSGSTSANVTVNSNPTASINGTFTACQGSTATLTASTSSTYLWSTGATTQTINPTVAGIYTVTVTNANGCTGSASQGVTINSNPSPSISGITSICQGTSTTLNATAGFNSYLWNTGATTSSITTSTAGTYTVTVTNANGCAGSTASTVIVNANPTPSITGTTTICQNNSTTLTATAGFSSYSWSTGATTAAITVTPSAATTYTVTVTNSNGCSGSTATSVTVNPKPAPTISGTFGVCSGAAATLTANATGATSYLWNTGAVTQTINPTTAGTYTVTVTNSFGCTGTASQAVTITSNPVPNITGTFTVCQGNTATLTATAGYTSYLWNTGAVTQTINPSAAGTYTVTVTGTGGCTGSKSQAVTVNPLPTVSISGSSTVCQGTTTTWSATSGLTSYLWSTGATTSNINVGTAGTYTVTATNSNGCSNTSSKQLTVNPTNATTQNVNRCPGTSYTLPSGQTVSVAGTYNSTLTNIYGCDSIVTTVLTFNDNIAPVASGCPAAFTTCNPATWTPPTFTDNCTFNVSSNFQPGVSLPLGNTTVTYTATDAGGNSTVCSFIITVVDFTLTTSQNNVTCFGLSNGSANVTATGTSGAVSYLWSNGATGATNTNLAAGTYTVTVTNGNCSKQTSVTITQPAQFNAAITPSGTTTFCQGGSVTLTATAATSYLWNTGATTQSVAAATSGNYFATVTNASGCTSVTAPVTVTVNPNVIASVSIASSATGSVSPTTSVTFTATAINAGASPSFQWKKNGVNVGTNSSTYTNNAWVNLDVITCVMTSNAVCVSGSPATSNAITVYVTTGGGGGSSTPKFVVSDVTANRVYYYDSTFTFIVSNPLSTTVLNGNTNASDVFMTATNGYILDGTANSRVYRSSLSGTVSVASRQLRTNTGAGLNPTTGLIIRGDTLYVVDKKGKAIYNYYLSQAYNGATTTLNAFAVKTLLTANSTAEALSFDGTYFYVLDNGSSVKSIYRYPLVGTAAGVRSRPMKTNTGANLGTVRGIVIDGNTVWITDSGSDRAFPYDKTLLFTGSNTVNLNATTVKTLNSGNLNSTGISITNTSSLLRQELPLQNDLHVTVWPNPTSGVVNISLEGIDANERFTLRAYDMNGRLVAFREEAGTDTEFTPAFDLTGIKSGMYAIVVEQGNRRKTVRVIVD